jgi:hypothetical protein
MNGHELDKIFYAWSVWSQEHGEVITKENVSGFVQGVQEAIAAGASERADDENDAALNTLFEILMQQNIVTGAESYLSLRCVGVPPDQEEFVQAVKRAILAAKEKES